MKKIIPLTVEKDYSKFQKKKPKIIPMTPKEIHPCDIFQTNPNIIPMTPTQTPECDIYRDDEIFEADKNFLTSP